MGSMGKELHVALVSECILYLESIGFKNIRKEVPIGRINTMSNKAIVVDIMATIDDEDIPIECRSIGPDYKERLKLIFSKYSYFYWYPFSGLLIKLTPNKKLEYSISDTEENMSICLRCGYQWPARVDNPKTCSHCKSPYWNKEKVKRNSFRCYKCNCSGSLRTGNVLPEIVRCPICNSSVDLIEGK